MHLQERVLEGDYMTDHPCMPHHHLQCKQVSASANNNEQHGTIRQYQKQRKAAATARPMIGWHCAQQYDLSRVDNVAAAMISLASCTLSLGLESKKQANLQAKWALAAGQCLC